MSRRVGKQIGWFAFSSLFFTFEDDYQGEPFFVSSFQESKSILRVGDIMCKGVGMEWEAFGFKQEEAGGIWNRECGHRGWSRRVFVGQGPTFLAGANCQWVHGRGGGDLPQPCESTPCQDQRHASGAGDAAHGVHAGYVASGQGMCAIGKSGPAAASVAWGPKSAGGPPPVGESDTGHETQCEWGVRARHLATIGWNGHGGPRRV